MDQQYFSKEGLEKLKKELEMRKGEMRQQIARRIKEAKEQGDLSENAEFSAAKDEQSTNEGKVEEIEILLENAVIISGGNHGGIIQVGSQIRVRTGKESHDYKIVGAAESNPLQGYISNESPLGNAFLGRKKGEKVSVSTPKGEIEYKILEVK